MIGREEQPKRQTTMKYEKTLGKHLRKVCDASDFKKWKKKVIDGKYKH